MLFVDAEFVPAFSVVNLPSLFSALCNYAPDKEFKPVQISLIHDLSHPELCQSMLTLSMILYD
jgi:hypothetical protein